MKAALTIFALLILVSVAVYFVVFPANTFITFKTPGGRGITLSRTSVALEPTADKFPTNGFAQVPSYVSRLLASREPRSSIIVATSDGQNALLLMRDAGQVILSVSADRTNKNGEEERMTNFFSERGMRPIQDYLSANGGVPDSVRICEYALSNDASAISLLCTATFTNLLGVGDSSGLEFTTHGLASKP